MYYNKFLKCAEDYTNPYVLVYDVYTLTDTDWLYMWRGKWLADRNCSSLCTENLFEWVVCDEVTAVSLLLKESYFIIDHYPFAKYAELVKTYCEFKEAQARRIVMDTRKSFPSYKALEL